MAVYENVSTVGVANMGSHVVTSQVWVRYEWFPQCVMGARGVQSWLEHE